MEGIREEIGQQPCFRIGNPFDVADQPQGGAISHASHHRVQAHIAKFLHKGFGADPVVAQEHHSFFAAFMGNIGHFFYDFCNFPALESLEILKFPGWDAVLVVVIALVNDVFGAERVAHFTFELLQDIRTDGCGIAVPIHVFFTGQFIEYEGELMEKCGEAEDIYIRVLLNEPAQAFHGKCVGLGLAYVKGDLVLHILPVVDHRVVHMNRIPHDVSQEADRIIVEGDGVKDDLSRGFVVMPVRGGYHLPGAPVNDLPPAGDIVPGVGGEHVLIQAFHQRDA